MKEWPDQGQPPGRCTFCKAKEIQVRILPLLHEPACKMCWGFIYLGEGNKLSQVSAWYFPGT